MRKYATRTSWYAANDVSRKVFSSAQENLETTPTTMGWDRRKATLGFGGCPHFPYFKEKLKDIWKQFWKEEQNSNY